jgi:FkbM family methyltransferase
MLTLLKNSLRPFYQFAKDRGYREYCRLLSRYSRRPRFQRQDVHFLNYSITVPDTLSFLYQFKEIFCDESYKFITQKKNPVIYDCGANIGLSCLYFKKIFPGCSIQAFEADPEIYRMLKSNLEKNTAMEGVTVNNQAVWTDHKGLDFFQDGADGGSVVHAAGKQAVRIPSVRLKELLVDRQIDLLKIDIEGAEVEVLLDCDGSFASVERVFFEYHSLTGKPQRLAEVLKVMTNNGFRYTIYPVHVQEKAPFVNLASGTMDLQLNVYCYRPV